MNMKTHQSRKRRKTDKQSQETLIYSEIGVIYMPPNCLSLSTGYNTAYPDLNINHPKKEVENAT